MTSSVGMMTFPIYGKNHVPNHQPDMILNIEKVKGNSDEFVESNNNIARSKSSASHFPG
jgi:hypothetical protein